MDSVSKKRQKELDEMSLLEEKDLGHSLVLKVTGGWIYWKTFTETGSNTIPICRSVAGVFVPEKQSQESKP